MSVICALHENGTTWIGSDTQTQDGGMVEYCGPKWVVSKNWAVGIAGDLRTLTLIENCKRSIFSANRTSVFQVAQAIKNLITEDGYQSNSDYGAQTQGSEFIIASKNNVWSLCQSFAIVGYQEGQLVAQGSGCGLAYGADFVAQDIFEPKERMEYAINAAIAKTTSCGGECWVDMFCSR